MVARNGRAGQQGEPDDAEQPAEVKYLWRVILLVEPDTNPWEFACKMARSGYIPTGEIWDTAEWADRIRENMRLLRLKQIALSGRMATVSS